jgi:hypothetical protein
MRIVSILMDETTDSNANPISTGVCNPPSYLPVCVNNWYLNVSAEYNIIVI